MNDEFGWIWKELIVVLSVEITLRGHDKPLKHEGMLPGVRTAYLTKALHIY